MSVVEEKINKKFLCIKQGLQQMKEVSSLKNLSGFWIIRDLYPAIENKKIEIETLALVLNPEFEVAEIEGDSFMMFLNSESELVRINYWNAFDDKTAFVFFKPEEKEQK